MKTLDELQQASNAAWELAERLGNEWSVATDAANKAFDAYMAAARARDEAFDALRAAQETEFRCQEAAWRDAGDA